MEFKVFKYQRWTILFLITFSIIFWLILPLKSFQQGELWGIPTIYWAIFTILITTLHQIYVWICWRLEIYHSIFTKAFTNHGFLIYEIGFFILFFIRIISVLLLSISNAGTLPVPLTVRLIIVGSMAIPMFYTFYSVIKYFGMHRAAGADHFLPKYREMPFVRQGIYKYTSNAMYIYGFFMFWIPAILFGSVTALMVALFNHIYIWVHYYTLEKPDFDILYESND